MTSCKWSQGLGAKERLSFVTVDAQPGQAALRLRQPRLPPPRRPSAIVAPGTKPGGSSQRMFSRGHCNYSRPQPTPAPSCPRDMTYPPNFPPSIRFQEAVNPCCFLMNAPPYQGHTEQERPHQHLQCLAGDRAGGRRWPGALSCSQGMGTAQEPQGMPLACRMKHHAEVGQASFGCKQGLPGGPRLGPAQPG